MNYVKETIEYLCKLFQWWVMIEPWERGIRTRFGKKVKLLEPGTHFRLPFFDSFYLQTIRLRVVSMAPQTISTMDGKTVTVSCSVGYSISNIMTLYNTLYQPEVTICNMVQAQIAEYIFTHDLLDCAPKAIEDHINQVLKDDYGIKYEYVKILGYAVVRTYRLIQDNHWTADALSTNNKMQH